MLFMVKTVATVKLSQYLPTLEHSPLKAHSTITMLMGNPREQACVLFEQLYRNSLSFYYLIQTYVHVFLLFFVSFHNKYYDIDSVWTVL